jgi:hypothetical protein
MTSSRLCGGKERFVMRATSPRQRKTTGRVMHEFKHGELKSGPAGKGGKVKSRRQAIAIALSEAGASKYDSNAKNKKHLARTERKEARGQTYQQEREGRRISAPPVDARAARLWVAEMRQRRQCGAVKRPAPVPTIATTPRVEPHHG